MIGAKNDAIVQKLQEHRAKKQSLWPKSQRDNADVEAEKEGDDNAGAGELGRNLSGSEVELEYGIIVKNNSDVFQEKYDTLILAVSHSEFLSIDLKKILKENSLVYDIKSFLDATSVDIRL